MVFGYECFKDAYISAHTFGLLVDNLLPVPKRDDGQQLAGCAAADGGVILQGADLFQNLAILGGQPTDAKTRQSESF